MTARDPRSALVLTGGGARGAYQVGVLKALADALPRGGPNPFPVVSGTSAGAINAAALACYADDFHHAVAALERVWCGFRIDHVVAADPWAMFRSSLAWFGALISGGVLCAPPRSLLDNAPLRALLEREVPLDRIAQTIADGHLHAVCVNASAYTLARSIAFYDGVAGLEDWARTRREGRRATLSVDHLMASVALPLVFPAARVGHEYYGDGSMRMGAPLSPALHLGADRLLVVALRNERPNAPPTADAPADYPSFGQIAGYMLDALFTDSLYNDSERLRRINETAAQVPGSALRPVQLMIVSPSEDPRDIAARHVNSLPRSMRALLWGAGALNRGGMQLVSYLLFESGYTTELFDLGYRDAQTRLPELLEFLS